MDGHLTSRQTNRTTLTADLVVPPLETQVSWCVTYRTIILSVLPVFLALLAGVFGQTMTISFVNG